MHARRYVASAGALAAATIVLGLATRPVGAQTPIPEATQPVAAFEAALDAHDAPLAARQLSDSAIVVGMESAAGKQQTGAWIQDQINHNVVIEIGPLSANGSRVTWTARISRGDWALDGSSVRYIDEEAAVVGNQITVLGAHERPFAVAAKADDVPYIRARSLLTATEATVAEVTLGRLPATVAAGVGLLTGLYVVSGFSPGATSAQKGKLMGALGKTSQLRRARNLT